MQESKRGVEAVQDTVSIIVPVYNVEDYLQTCVRSLIDQTYQEIEILLVDDGSTDSSGALCDYLATLDTRIKVLHKENGGQAAARNYGLTFASGKWSAFVDSDDVVSKSYIEELLTAALECDASFSICGFESFSSQAPKFATVEKTQVVQSKSITGLEAARNMFLLRQIYPSAWGKLGATGLWKTYPFPEGRVYEDFPVIWKLLLDTESVAIIDRNLYFYRRRAGSTVSSASFKSIKDHFVSIKQVDDEVNAFGLTTLQNPAYFLLSVECCRLYRSCLDFGHAARGEIDKMKDWAVRYVRRHIFEVMRVGEAPMSQRCRILAFALLPKTSIQLSNHLLSVMRRKEK